MPGADFIAFPSNQVDENPDYAPGAILKPKLPDRLLENLRSRHSFTKQLLKDGYDIRIVHELLGYKDISTTKRRQGK
jgi:hypothetical protein